MPFGGAIAAPPDRRPFAIAQLARALLLLRNIGGLQLRAAACAQQRQPFALGGADRSAAESAPQTVGRRDEHPEAVVEGANLNINNQNKRWCIRYNTLRIGDTVTKYMILYL